MRTGKRRHAGQETKERRGEEGEVKNEEEKRMLEDERNPRENKNWHSMRGYASRIMQRSSFSGPYSYATRIVVRL